MILESNLKQNIIPVEQWGIFPAQAPIIIAGPCSAESESQVLETAQGLNSFGVRVFRAGIWKPRTRPGGFEGVGPVGLEWFKRVKADFGMKVCTEVASGVHVAECLNAGIDMLWLGARTTANPFLVQEIASALKGSDIPVLVKNPAAQDMDLWIGALERLSLAGVRKLGVIHRGFATSEAIAYRNDPGWNIAIELRTRYPELPFFFDPSHIAGDRKYLAELSQRAIDLGIDGMMIESHIHPETALSDASQQLTPSALGQMLENICVRRKDSLHNDNLASLRARIDVIDESILRSLKARMDVSREIGEFKKEHNMAILQTSRWDEVLASMVKKGKEYGLSENFIKTVFSAVHQESVSAQDEILRNK